MIKSLDQYKYKILCFVLFISLIINIALYHENRIYKKGILQAMSIIGLNAVEEFDLPTKNQIGILNQYLEELWGELP